MRVSYGRTLDELEQQAIFNALSETGGRQDRAARLLGISQRTLIRKLKIYAGVEHPHEAQAPTQLEVRS